jgi:hypothetical protein
MPQTDTDPQSAASQRLYLPTLAELIDRLTVDQIKEVILSQNKASYAEEMRLIEHDIDQIIQEKDIKLSAHLIRIVIVLAQFNLHIWNNKDKMQEDPEHYAELLIMAHKLNGIRNQVKNRIMEASGDRQPAARHTNVSTDDLQGWDISI